MFAQPGQEQLRVISCNLPVSIQIGPVLIAQFAAFAHSVVQKRLTVILPDTTVSIEITPRQSSGLRENFLSRHSVGGQGIELCQSIVRKPLAGGFILKYCLCIDLGVQGILLILICHVM